MSKTTHNSTEIPVEFSLKPEQSELHKGMSPSPLDQIVREGTRKMLHAALEAEVQEPFSLNTKHALTSKEGAKSFAMEPCHRVRFSPERDLWK